MDFTAARTTMVDNQIRTEDVTDWDVLRAFLTVPREEFVPKDQRALAYIGRDLQIAPKRRLMAPSSFARLLQLLLVGSGDRVLDVGSGTGYASAILSHLAGSVVALEENAELAAFATDALEHHAEAGKVSVRAGPLRDGWPQGAPFDRIFVGGSVDEVPEALIDQLADNGRLVAAEGRGNAAEARLYVRKDGYVSNRFAFNASVPPLPGFQRPPQFVF